MFLCVIYILLATYLLFKLNMIPIYITHYRLDYGADNRLCRMQPSVSYKYLEPVGMLRSSRENYRIYHSL